MQQRAGTHLVRVFFATARQPLTWRIACRRPDLARAWFLSALIRFLSRSPLAHVCIESEGAVLDPALQGNRYWPTLAFIHAYPTLAVMVTVPVARLIPFEKYPADGLKRVLPTVIRWHTRGRTSTHDCCCVAADCLCLASVNVPLRMVSDSARTRPESAQRTWRRQGQRCRHELRRGPVRFPAL